MSRKKIKSETKKKSKKDGDKATSFSRIAFYLCYSFFVILVVGLLFLYSHRNELNIEKKVFELINEKREEIGLSRLKWDSDLYDSAKNHSKTMKSENSFFNRAGEKGENIASVPVHYWTEGCWMTFTNNQIAGCIYSKWLENSQSNDNMFNPGYKRTGIGVSCSFLICKATQSFV
jgi:uncharacterized protein YkwD